TLVGAEALVRWEHPQRGLIAPGHFIGLAEETNLTLAVNVSARQFNQPDFVEQVLSVLARTGARARQLMPWFQA
ncbi:MAG: hypothetical protein RIR45_707, partial [Pseudomonadota bacterium]